MKSNTTLNGLTVNQKQDESTPVFVQTEELYPLYCQSDLSFRYMYQKCLTLAGLKGVPIAFEQASLWYCEMLREKWNKQKFDEQYNALKIQKVYGAFDWAQWNEGIEMIPVQTVKDRAIAEVNRYADGIRFQTKVLKSQFDHVTVNSAAIALEELRRARLDLAELVTRKEEEERDRLRKKADEFYLITKESGDISEIEAEFPELAPAMIYRSLRQFCNVVFYKKQGQQN